MLLSQKASGCNYHLPHQCKLICAEIKSLPGKPGGNGHQVVTMFAASFKRLTVPDVTFDPPVHVLDNQFFFFVLFLHR